jgi:hypothetical protein
MTGYHAAMRRAHAIRTRLIMLGVALLPLLIAACTQGGSGPGY